MTIGGALSELNNLLKADNIPIYYKPSILKIIETIELEQEPCEDCISRKEVEKLLKSGSGYLIWGLPSVQPKPKTEVLDKIRAEIEALEEGMTSYYNDRPWIFKDEVLDIIDKYKAESEDKGCT